VADNGFEVRVMDFIVPLWTVCIIYSRVSTDVVPPIIYNMRAYQPSEVFNWSNSLSLCVRTICPKHMPSLLW
jgi:hypothetical protein